MRVSLMQINAHLAASQPLHSERPVAADGRYGARIVSRLARAFWCRFREFASLHVGGKPFSLCSTHKDNLCPYGAIEIGVLNVAGGHRNLTASDIFFVHYAVQRRPPRAKDGIKPAPQRMVAMRVLD